VGQIHGTVQVMLTVCVIYNEKIERFRHGWWALGILYDVRYSCRAWPWLSERWHISYIT